MSDIILIALLIDFIIALFVFLTSEKLFFEILNQIFSLKELTVKGLVSITLFIPFWIYVIIIGAILSLIDKATSYISPILNKKIFK